MKERSAHPPRTMQTPRRSNRVTNKSKRHFQEQIYGKEEYESNNGMLTTIWGPATWHLLHCISFNYPVEPNDAQKQHYREFVLNLKHVIPCGKCRTNLEKNFGTLPLEERHMASRETFSRYIYDLHEVVNRMLNKKSGLTYDAVRDIYEHFRARCANDAKKPIQKSYMANVKTAKSSTAKSSTAKSSTVKSSTAKSSTVKSSTAKSSTAKSETAKGIMKGRSESTPRTMATRGGFRTTRKHRKSASASEKGCVVPFNGKKTKCVLRIVPQSTKCKTFSM